MKKPKKIPMSIIHKREKRALKRKQKGDLARAKREMFERDGGKCVFCGFDLSNSKHFQSCHIIPEEFEESRYDVNNLLLACFNHHKVGRYSMHNNPLWFCKWLEKNRPNQYYYLLDKYAHLIYNTNLYK